MWSSHHRAPLVKRFHNFLPFPEYLEDAPPSPFFGRREDSTVMKSSNQEFVREARTVEEEEDPEEYYNHWVMSNLG